MYSTIPEPVRWQFFFQSHKVCLLHEYYFEPSRNSRNATPARLKGALRSWPLAPSSLYVRPGTKEEGGNGHDRFRHRSNVATVLRRTDTSRPRSLHLFDVFSTVWHVLLQLLRFFVTILPCLWLYLFSLFHAFDRQLTLSLWIYYGVELTSRALLWHRVLGLRIKICPWTRLFSRQHQTPLLTRAELIL